jgi:hypothetical protein
VEVPVPDADAADVDTPGDLAAARRRGAPGRGRPPLGPGPRVAG